MLNNGPITWLSQKQSTICTSTCEAELCAAFTATKDAVWLRQLLSDVGKGSKSPTTLMVSEDEHAATPLMVDNQGTLKYIHNPISNNQRRSKHWDIKFKYVKEMHSRGIIQAEYVNTKDQLADLLTKPLPPDRFNHNVSQLNLINDA